MDPILAEVYSTVLPAAPFVVAAYVGIWVVLVVYVFVLSRRAKRTERDLDALKRALDARDREHE
ncbi:CcmD family protein [Collinsella intestinalis]|uniref:CcmD family protein n=1 Tax=Collinsella intestinalis TaxID=147207 RepID=UPI001957417D|nr:CcmD family protein [Collinsella intestinalis]MBM6683784.1 CcmD family protein [Collinsella intestinalis]